MLLGVSALARVNPAPMVFAEPAEHAAAKPEDTAIIITKEVTGKVSAINTRGHFLTLIYQQDKAHGVENEILLTFQDDLKLQLLRDLRELKFGDTIKVSYEEKQQDAERKTEDGKSEPFTKVLSRDAKVIMFVKPKSMGLVTNE